MWALLYHERYILATEQYCTIPVKYAKLWHNKYMITSQLNTYQIADFVEWHRNKQLVLNPDFQRRAVWTQPARVFLIDTILRELSLPKFYIRTKIDLSSREIVREVVDGQQRLTAILDFANDKFVLTKRASEFEGYTYSTLPDELQEKFLKYTLAVEHLVNANDSDVLEVFSRLNSYGETLNAAEKRHAEFQGEFKWLAHNSAQKYSSFWDKYKVIGLQQRVRMADDETMAELYGILLEGIRDGGSPYINGLYSRYDEKVPDMAKLEFRMNILLEALDVHYGSMLNGPLGRRPQFLMLFAAVAHAISGIPSGDVASMPVRKNLKESGEASTALGRLSEALTSDENASMPADLSKFRAAAKSSTQRIKSREIRFKTIYAAIIK